MGSGWTDRDNGRLGGDIAYDNRDQTTFIAEPWRLSATH